MRPLDSSIPDLGAAKTNHLQAGDKAVMDRPQPARAARLQSGMSLREAAQALGVQPEYLARLERAQRFPYHLACQLARLYRCGLDRFLCYVFSDPDAGDGAETKSGGAARRGRAPLR